MSNGESTQLAPVPQRGGDAIAHYNPAQLDLLKRTICNGATDDEFQLFVGVCNRTGLDPFTRQIHAVKRWDGKLKREVMAIQVGIDGFRLIAGRTGELDGQEGPYWCGEDGVWKELWTETTPPFAARVVVFRKGVTRGFTGVAKYAQFAQFTKEGKPNHFWAKMPDHMLAKVAEAQALRKAFPQELSGLFEAAEAGAAQPESKKASAKRINQMVASFERLGVSAEDLADYLDHAIDATTEQETLDLLEIFRSIRDGKAPAAQFFPKDSPQAQEPPTATTPATPAPAQPAIDDADFEVTPPAAATPDGDALARDDMIAELRDRIADAGDAFILSEIKGEIETHRHWIGDAAAADLVKQLEERQGKLLKPSKSRK